MNKSFTFLYCLSIVLIFAACNGKKTTEATTDSLSVQNSMAKLNLDHEKLQSYRQFLGKLDTTNLLSSGKAGTEFMQIFKNADKTTCDSAYSLFKSFHESMLVPQGKIVDAENESFLELFMDTGKPNKRVKEFYEELKKNGFELDVTEGYVYVALKPDFQKKYVYELLSPAMQTYFTQWTKEYEEGLSSDAGLIIEPKALAERIVFWEKFEQQNPDFQWKEDVKANQRNYAYILLNGMENTPTFDYETKQIDETYRIAYKFLAEENKNTRIGKLFQEYSAILSKNSLKDSPQAQTFRTKLKL